MNIQILTPNSWAAVISSPEKEKDSSIHKTTNFLSFLKVLYKFISDCSVMKIIKILIIKISGMIPGIHNFNPFVGSTWYSVMSGLCLSKIMGSILGQCSNRDYLLNVNNEE